MSSEKITLTGVLRKYEDGVIYADKGDVAWNKKDMVHVKLREQGDHPIATLIWAHWKMPYDADEAFITQLVENTAYVEVESGHVIYSQPIRVGGICIDTDYFDDSGLSPKQETPFDANANNPAYGIF